MLLIPYSIILFCFPHFVFRALFPSSTLQHNIYYFDEKSVFVSSPHQKNTCKMMPINTQKNQRFAFSPIFSDFQNHQKN